MSDKFVPRFSKARVNKAGSNLALGKVEQGDQDVIENWRAAHNHVLNTFQENLRRKAKLIGARTPVQRLKRLETIRNKLLRFPKMQLARMHDIVGCRVVFDDLKTLYEFRSAFNSSRFDHKRRIKVDAAGNKFDAYNYITNPKESGYRGIHDVFSYKAKQGGALKNSAGGEKWNGLHIEIQYRTSIQHAWATAVEICDNFTENHGKFSHAPDDYLEYFRLSSEILSRHFEKSVSFESDLSDNELVARFSFLENQYGMLRTLSGIKPFQENFDEKRHTLLTFNQETDAVSVQTFSTFREAVEQYFNAERNKSEGYDVVLVAADDSDSVRYGFKNYFSDAGEFVNLMMTATKALNE